MGHMFLCTKCIILIIHKYGIIFISQILFPRAHAIQSLETWHLTSRAWIFSMRNFHLNVKKKKGKFISYNLLKHSKNCSRYGNQTVKLKRCAMTESLKCIVYLIYNSLYLIPGRTPKYHIFFHFFLFLSIFTLKENKISRKENRGVYNA